MGNEENGKHTRRAFLVGTGAVVLNATVGCSTEVAPADAASAADLGRPPDAASAADAQRALDATAGSDSGASDAGRQDASLDSGATDSGPANAGDTGPGDSGAADAGPGDSGPTSADSGPQEDAGPSVDDPESVPTSMAFALGVASGDALPDAAILWTRYTGMQPLRVVVWEMQDTRYVRIAFERAVMPSADGFVHVEATGLRAGLRHRYAFFETSGTTRVARSRIGRFRTALAAGSLEPLLFAASSCTSNSRTPLPLERAGARTDVDALFLLGDTTYNDGSTTLPQYRAKWSESLSKTGYLAAREASGLVATWDDHEIDNNWNPETMAAAQVATARQTFFEHLPLRRDAAAPDRIWKSLRWGATCELFVLDCRGERRPSTRQSANPIYVSRAQLDWLKAGLMASPCVFKVILNSVPISDFPGLFDLAPQDRWEGYAAQRTEILRFIDDAPIRGVLWVAGDFHLASAQRVSTSGPGATQVEILAGPGAQSANPLTSQLRAPQFDFGSGTNNYTTIALDPIARSARVRWIDGMGVAFQDRTYAL